MFAPFQWGTGWRARQLFSHPVAPDRLTPLTHRSMRPWTSSDWPANRAATRRGCRGSVDPKTPAPCGSPAHGLSTPQHAWASPVPARPPV